MTDRPAGGRTALPDTWRNVASYVLNDDLPHFSETARHPISRPCTAWPAT
ncbi:MAG: hypothetical protein IPM98_03000 [Lewinellaceae bacterium]|nr:hypothetical protein [Lewinellaceae bacterium]